MVGICANCGRKQVETTTVTYWTGRETTHVIRYNGSIERQTATQYEGWRSHPYTVCARCFRRARTRMFVVPGVYLVLMLLVLLLVMLTRLPYTIEIWMIVLGGLISFGVAMLAAGRWRLPRLALNERKREDPHGRYKVTTSRQFKIMNHKRDA